MEKLIEELTKVNPSNLSEEGLKLFNKINEIIDRNKELEKENNKLNNANKTYINCIQSITPVLMQDYIEKSLIKEKIEELKEELERDRICIDFVIEHKRDIELIAKIDILEELLNTKM